MLWHRKNRAHRPAHHLDRKVVVILEVAWLVLAAAIIALGAIVIW